MRISKKALYHQLLYFLVYSIKYCYHSCKIYLIGHDLDLNGRRLIILPALNRTEVDKMKIGDKETESKEPRNKNSLDYLIYQDKHKTRNLYLSKVGLNDPHDQV